MCRAVSLIWPSMLRAVGARTRARSPWVIVIRPIRCSVCIASRPPAAHLESGHQVAFRRQRVAGNKFAAVDPGEKARKHVVRELAPRDRFEGAHVSSA
jgi:hypothetical protein